MLAQRIELNERRIVLWFKHSSPNNNKSHPLIIQHTPNFPLCQAKQAVMALNAFSFFGQRTTTKKVYSAYIVGIVGATLTAVAAAVSCHTQTHSMFLLLSIHSFIRSSCSCPFRCHYSLRKIAGPFTIRYGQFPHYSTHSQ